MTDNQSDEELRTAFSKVSEALKSSTKSIEELNHQLVTALESGDITGATYFATQINRAMLSNIFLVQEELAKGITVLAAASERQIASQE